MLTAKEARIITEGNDKDFLLQMALMCVRRAAEAGNDAALVSVKNYLLAVGLKNMLEGMGYSISMLGDHTGAYSITIWW
jgi:hypothetical protein